MTKSRVRRSVIWGSKSDLGFEPSQNWQMIELLSDCNGTLTCVALAQFQTNLGMMKLSPEVLALFPKNGLPVSPGISSRNGGQSRNHLGLIADPRKGVSAVAHRQSLSRQVQLGGSDRWWPLHSRLGDAQRAPTIDPYKFHTTTWTAIHSQVHKLS